MDFPNKSQLRQFFFSFIFQCLFFFYKFFQFKISLCSVICGSSNQKFSVDLCLLEDSIASKMKSMSLE